MLQGIGDMHVLALLQQAQVQRSAQAALESLDKQALQAGADSEQQQELALQVLNVTQLLSCGVYEPSVVATSLHHAHAYGFGI